MISNLIDFSKKHLRYCTAILSHDEITLEVPQSHLLQLMHFLKTHQDSSFDTLIDVCAIDYLHFGQDQWVTQKATSTGYSRAVEDFAPNDVFKKARFAVVYHLLSTVHNHRIRVKSFVENKDLLHPSVNDIWGAANWYEREAFDLMGILFTDHPDLRRLLTDYGFVGHPFRKDFPLSGEVEMRYDATLERCVYEPVDIEPRVTVPKSIRKDSRYLGGRHPGDGHD